MDSLEGWGAGNSPLKTLWLSEGSFLQFPQIWDLHRSPACSEDSVAAQGLSKLRTHPIAQASTPLLSCRQPNLLFIVNVRVDCSARRFSTVWHGQPTARLVGSLDGKAHKWAEGNPLNKPRARFRQNDYCFTHAVLDGRMALNAWENRESIDAVDRHMLLVLI